MCNEMDPANVQEEVEILEERIDPDTEESEENNLNATSVSALDMILKSLLKIRVFLNDVLKDFGKEAHLMEDESVLPQDMLRRFLLKDLNLFHLLEANCFSDLFLNLLELLPHWNSHFEVNVVAKKRCNRCKTETEHPGERSRRMVISANSLREFKSAFNDFTFETILKVIRINETIPCDKRGCGERNYVNRTINKLPSVFAIALKWENNETDQEEISDTASVLATEIDISVIYRYEGDSPFIKYRLLTMVWWSHEDLYNCVAYDKKRWVRHFCSKIVVIGDWDDVLKLHIRPEILLFKQASQRIQM